MEVTLSPCSTKSDTSSNTYIKVVVIEKYKTIKYENTKVPCSSIIGQDHFGRGLGCVVYLTM